MATTSAPSPPPDLLTPSTTETGSPSLLTPTPATASTMTTAFDTPPQSITPTTTTTTALPLGLASPTTSSTPTSTTSSSSTFKFPPHHSFPPFYTLQPNHQILTRQLTLWSALITTYCASESLFRLSLSNAASTPLFNNKSIHRSLDLLSIRKIIDYMSTPEGGLSAEWLVSDPRKQAQLQRGSRSAAASLRDEDKTAAWIWWRRPEEWAEAVYAWVDGTGQKGSVLTIYELRESEAVEKEAWVGMEEEMFRRCLEVLVKKGRCQIFEGQGGDGVGVKFF